MELTFAKGAVAAFTATMVAGAAGGYLYGNAEAKDAAKRDEWTPGLVGLGVGIFALSGLMATPSDPKTVITAARMGVVGLGVGAGLGLATGAFHISEGRPSPQMGPNGTVIG